MGRRRYVPGPRYGPNDMSHRIAHRSISGSQLHAAKPRPAREVVPGVFRSRLAQKDRAADYQESPILGVAGPCGSRTSLEIGLRIRVGGHCSLPNKPLLFSWLGGHPKETPLNYRTRMPIGVPRTKLASATPDR